MAEPEDKTPPRTSRPQGIPVGDFKLSLGLEASNVNESVNEIIERLQRSLEAFRAEWNRK